MAKTTKSKPVQQSGGKALITNFDIAVGQYLDVIGNLLVASFHRVALFVIGALNAWAAGLAVIKMLGATEGIQLDDLLLLFIYLEIGAMVGIYFKTRHMPVRYLIYVAITALTRLLISDAGTHHGLSYEILLISGAIAVLALAALILRFGSFKFPSNSSYKEE